MTTPTTNEAWTIGRLLTWTTEYFDQRGVDEPRLTAEVLLAHAAGRRRIDLYTRFEEQLESEPLARFRVLVKRAADHEPFAYLVGEKEFYSLGFHVSSAVLIPRPETETLVQVAVETGKESLPESATVLDLGTGSGCIAIAIASQWPTARIFATDNSLEALEVARRNADRHGVADRIVFVEADKLNLPADSIPAGGFDLIVSNPPYIPVEQMATLDETVRTFEPALALTDGSDGLSFYRCLAEGAGEVLASGGWVIVEVADGQAAAVVEIMTARGTLGLVQTTRDRVTRRERVVAFQQQT